MEDLIEKVKDVQDRLFTMEDSDNSNLKPFDELSILSDLPSYPSVILEKFDFPDTDSEEEEELITQKEQKANARKPPTIVNENDDFSEIPPDPPVKLAPSYAIPIKAKNFLVPDLTGYSTATVIILKGKDFPQTKSGVRSSYVTFQFDQTLPVTQTPVCYNHEGEAYYNCGFNIDISKINIDHALPIIEAYDIISDKHQDLIGFNAVQFQHSKLVDDYLVVLENEWVQLFMPHTRKKAGFILVSLYLHNGHCPAIPEPPVKQKVQKTSPIKQQTKDESAKEISQESKEAKEQKHEQPKKKTTFAQPDIKQEKLTVTNNEPNKQEEKSNSMSLPVKGEVSQTMSTTQEDTTQKHQTGGKFSFLPNVPKRLPDVVVDDYTYKQESDVDKTPKIQLKTDFQFNVDDNELINTLSLDVLHPFSWSKLAKRKRVLRWMDIHDLEYPEPTEEIETQTDFPTKNKFTQTYQNQKQQKSIFSKTETLSRNMNSDQNDQLSKTTPVKLPQINSQNEFKEVESDPSQKEPPAQELPFPFRSYDMDNVHYNLFTRDDEYIGYSDYGLFAHRILDEF